MPEQGLDGKTVLLFGAGALASGYAPMFAEAGANLTVAGINSTQDELAAVLTPSSGRKVITVEANVTDPAQIEQAYRRTLDEFGSIDVVVNGAGGNIRSATVKSAEEYLRMDPKDARFVMDLNFWSKVYSIEQYARTLAASGKQGRVVNITSMSGLCPLSMVVYYSAAFAAVENYTRSAADLWGKNSWGEINNVAVGFTVGEQNRALLLNDDDSLTERGQEIISGTALGRFVTPEEVGKAVLYLADRQASPGIAAVTHRIDGGFMAVDLPGTAGYKPIG